MSTPSQPEPDRHAVPPPTYFPPPYPYGYAPPPPPRTNGMSIAAMVLGIVGVCTPVGVLGLVFGLVGKRQIRERGEQGEGFAIAGVVLGWVAVAATVVWILYFVALYFLINSAVHTVDPESWPSVEPSE